MGESLGSGRLAEVLVVLPVWGGTSSATRWEGLGRTRSWLICLAFVLFRCIMARWRRPGGVCLPVLFSFGLGTLVFFWGCISGCCGGTRFLVLLKLFQGIFSWFGFGKASGIGSGCLTEQTGVDTELGSRELCLVGETNPACMPRYG